MKTNKYNYYKVIQQNYSNYWEDVSYYPCNSMYNVIDNKSGVFKINSKGKKIERKLINVDFENYCALGYPTRIIKRKKLAYLDN